MLVNTLPRIHSSAPSTIVPSFSKPTAERAIPEASETPAEDGFLPSLGLRDKLIITPEQKDRNQQLGWTSAGRAKRLAQLHRVDASVKAVPALPQIETTEV